MKFSLRFLLLILLSFLHDVTGEGDSDAEGHFLRSKSALIKEEELATEIQTKDPQSAWWCVCFLWCFGPFREVSFVFPYLSAKVTWQQLKEEAEEMRSHCLNSGLKQIKWLQSE